MLGGFRVGRLHGSGRGGTAARALLGAGVAGGLVLAGVAAGPLDAAQAAHGAVTEVHTVKFQVRGPHTWYVPLTVRSVTFDVYGAQGGKSPGVFSDTTGGAAGRRRRRSP